MIIGLLSVIFFAQIGGNLGANQNVTAPVVLQQVNSSNVGGSNLSQSGNLNLPNNLTSIQNNGGIIMVMHSTNNFCKYFVSFLVVYSKTFV